MKKALIVSCFEEWYKNRLMPICNILSKRDYSIKCVLSDYNHFCKRYSEKKEKNCTYIHVPRYKRNISFHRIRSHLVFGKKVSKIIKSYKPDLIYLVIPPNNSARYCLKYKRNNPNVKLIIDIIDLWPESLPLGSLRVLPPAKIWQNWRNDIIKVADYVFTECDLYQEKLKGVLIPSKSSTLHLYKNQTEEERKLVNEIIDNKIEDEVIRFAYLGSMNNIIDIVGICGVVQTFIKSGYKCEFHAIGDGESKECFYEALSATGCKVIFYGPIFEELEKIRILTQCDYAFNMMKCEISVGLTIKSIDYLSYGLPMINNIKGDTWALIENEKIGINVSNGKVSHCRFDHRYILEVFNNHFSKQKFIESVNEAL